MKMHEVKSITWNKMAEIPTDDFSIEGITEAINDEFGELFFDGILEAIADGYIQVCLYRDWETDRKSTRLNSSHSRESRMPSSA